MSDNNPTELATETTTTSAQGDVPSTLWSGYAELDDAQREFVQAKVQHIRERGKQFAQSVLDIGHDLMAVKKKLPHGRFGDWLRHEFNMSEDSAENYMRAARLVDENPKYSELPPTALYLLAAPSTPASVRRDAASGKIPPTIKDVQRAIRERGNPALPGRRSGSSKRDPQTPAEPPDGEAPQQNGFAPLPPTPTREWRDSPEDEAIRRLGWPDSMVGEARELLRILKLISDFATQISANTDTVHRALDSGLLSRDDARIVYEALGEALSTTQANPSKEDGAS